MVEVAPLKMVKSTYELEISDATTDVYGGRAKFDYRMEPLGVPGQHATATFDASYGDVDLTQLTNPLQTDGIRLAGRISGRNLLEWPLGAWSQHRGDGEVHGVPPAGAALMTRQMPLERIAARAARGKAYGPFSSETPQDPVAVGGDIVYRYGPEWVDIAPSHIATADTYVDIQGRTAYGDRSRLEFHVSSADWQESDRVFAGVLTAFGSRTGAIDIGGYGTFDGLMVGSFRCPRIEGKFAGEQVRAFDVVWGSVGGGAVIENSYASVENVVVRNGGATIDTDGTFSLGFPRKDRGEEINARVRITRWPVKDLRHAFELDEYQLDGLATGEFHVYGEYQRPLGFGTLSLAQGVAYGEPFDSADTGVRLEGDGVRLDNIQVVKSTGKMTGAAFVGWNGTYSFQMEGRNIPVESIAAAKSSPVPLSGLIDFTAGGSGSFDAPRYDVRGTVRDLFAADEGIGQVVGDISVNDRLLTLKVEAASPRLAVSGAGRIELTPEMDTELTFNIADTSLDPYVRALQPQLSPYTTAVASGSVHVVGELADIDHLLVDARVDKLDARLFDYQIHNDVPIRIALDRNTIRVGEMRLVGDGTQLDVSGTVNLRDEKIGMRVTGDANLAVLQGFVSNVRSSGRAMLSAALQGSMRDPAVTGTLTIDNGRIRHFALPHALENIDGTLQFDSRGVTLDGLNARLGGGTVQFFGRVDKQGYRAGRIDVTMTGQNMRLRFPEGMRSTVDATLMLQGTMDNATLSGDVYVSDSLYTRGFDTGGGLLDLGGGSPAPAGGGGGGGGSPVTLPLRYDVRIDAPSTLRVRNNNIRLTASADLQLRGTYERPLVFGRAEVENGDVLFEGKRYVVTRGTIDFNNPTKIQPFFDVEAETRVRVPDETYIVTLRAAGTVDRMTFDLTSDPPLPQPEILALLFSDVAPGRDVEFRQYSTDITPQQQLLRERAARALAGPISSEVGRVVEQTFGVDTFQLTPSLVDPNAQSSRLDPGARLTLGKRISDRFYLTYARSLSSSTRDQNNMLESDQTDRYSWILSRNEDGTYAVEARVRHVF
jgi:translocation and assembly module TamB